MANELTLRAGLFGALCLQMAPAVAQDAGGVQTVFGIEQGLEHTRNASLGVPAGDDRTAATTRLSYGITSETRTQRLRFDAAGIYRLDRTDGETDGNFEGPTLTLAYTRQGADGSLNVAANYNQRNIDTLPPLSDFINDAGVLELPDDFTDLTGTGQRTAYSATGTLILREDAPLSFQFDLGANGTTYRDATDPDLTDSTGARLRGTTRLQFSPVLSGTIGLGYAVTDEDDSTDSRRSTRDIDLGLGYSISPRARLDASIGSVRTETEQTSGNTETTGLTGRLGFGYDMPNGGLLATLDTSRDVAGDQVMTAQLTRNLDLPTGSLSFSVGATRPENDETAFVGNVDWVNERPTSSLLLRLNRSVSVDEDADIRRRTLAAAYYSYVINSVSQLNVGASYVLSEASSATTEVERRDLGVSYSHALTPDWDVNTGLGVVMRDEDGVGRAESSQISLSISREFSARR